MEIRMLLKIAFCYLSLIVLQINCKPTFNKVPIIQSVERLDENRLKLSWTIDHDSETLYRYRIFFARDGAGDRLFEWPAQINRLDNDVLGTNYRSFWYKDAFECYKQCVINPICIFAAYRTFSNKLAQDAQSTCLMKTKLDKSLATGVISSSNSNVATEYIEIADYKSEAILSGLPTHIAYSFSVIVYDRELDDWSEESEIYEYKPPKLDSRLQYEFRNGHIFSWTQPRSGDDRFTISRYTLVLWEDGQLNREKISIKDGITPFKFNLDYYNDDISPIYAASDNECLQLCIGQASCVRYAFSTATNDCHLMGKFDLTNCKLIPKNSVVFSLRRDSNEFRLRNHLKPRTSYNALLEFLTPYGFTGRSNILKFQTGEFENVEKEQERETTTKKPTKQAETTRKSETTKASVEEKPTVVEEVDEYFVVPGSGGGSSSETEKPEPIDYPLEGGSESGSSGGSDGNEGEIETEGGDQTKLEINLESSQTKRVKERFEIECTYRGSSKKNVIWAKKFDSFKFLSTEIIRSNEDKTVTNKLVFDSLTRKDDGTYSCYTEDRPQDSRNLLLNVKDVPSKPVIVKATTSKESGSVIRWGLEDDGGLDPIKGVIEISTDFQDPSVKIEVIELNNEDLIQKEVQIEKEVIIEKGSFVRLSLENAVGTSEKSDEVQVISDDTPTDVTEILAPAGVLLGAETTSSSSSLPSTAAAVKVESKKPDDATKAAEKITQRPKAFSFLLMIAAILFLVIIAYAVYRCKFAGKSDQDGEKVKDDEEQQKQQQQPDETKTLVDNKQGEGDK